jgi:signal transduction histidine kinase
MDALVTSILEAARLADGRLILQKETHDMVRFLWSVISDWKKTQPEYELAFEPPVEALPLQFDAERLRQVLDNLISNAVKYGLPCKRIEVALVPGPSTAEVRVRDFGPGIDAADLPRIFGRFYRARDVAGSGHGLGLYIAAALARLHGGALRVDSKRGEGSTFTIVLPRS